MRYQMFVHHASLPLPISFSGKASLSLHASAASHATQSLRMPEKRVTEGEEFSTIGNQLSKEKL